jgi:hypothetical protein
LEPKHGTRDEPADCRPAGLKLTLSRKCRTTALDPKGGRTQTPCSGRALTGDLARARAHLRPW